MSSAEYPVEIEVLQSEGILDQNSREIHTLLTHLSPEFAWRFLSETRKQLVEMAESENSYLVVAKNIGQIVGMTTVNYVPTPLHTYGVVDGVVKAPSSPRRVVGPLLVNAVCHHAFEVIDAHHLQLTSNATRSAARSLYRHAGFSIRDTDVFSLNKQDWIAT